MSCPDRYTAGESVPISHCVGDQGEPQNLSGRCGEKENLLPMPGIEPQFSGRPFYNVATTKVTKLNSVVLVRKRTILSDRRMSAKLVPTFADRRCRVVSATDPHGR
jgi:hypothetical protein